MNLKIIDLIYRKNKFLSKEQCNYFINIFEKHKNFSFNEKSSKYIEGKINFDKKDNYMSLDLSKDRYEHKEINEALLKAWEYIVLAVESYIKHLQLNISFAINGHFINSTSNIRILKYPKGSNITDHLDIGIKRNNRASCTINLNEEYLGGEFTFFSGKHVETFKTGDLMVFPADIIWIHGTKPIISGTRYAINCFLHNQ